MDNQLGELAKVLLVDDSQAEITLAKMYLRREKVQLELSFFRDGENVVNYLQQQVKTDLSTLPDLILLDINMPTMNGKAVLTMLKQDESLKDIPVVMYSGSDAPSDMIETRALGALDYVVKPLNYQKLRNVIENVNHLHFHEGETDKILCKVKC